ncbi:BolA-like protein 2, variant 2 [Trebouxia sp. C0010 RCD-2024]
MVTAAEVEQALKQRLEAKDVTVVDDSGGCGSSFIVAVVSDQFEGKKLLDRHKLVCIAVFMTDPFQHLGLKQLAHAG